MPRIWKYTLALLAASLFLIFIAAFSLTDNRLHLVFCDVGQGDAILVSRGSTQILVDGGPDSRVLSCLSSHMPFWDRKIELVVLSHPELDHYGGLIDVVRRYQIMSFAGSGVGKDNLGVKTLKEEIEKRKVGEMVISSGTQMKVGEMELGVVWPAREYLASQGLTLQNDGGTSRRVLGVSRSGSANEFSLVLQLKYGEFDALLTGDIEPPATDMVAQRLAPSGVERVEVLKVPHHGSKNGLTEKLLEATQPKLAIISVGKNNRYGHPHPEAVKLISDQAIKLLRTDLEGTIEIVTDGERWWLRGN